MSKAIYASEGRIWTPNALAKGPFPGQHGGVVAGVLAAAMERKAAEMDAGLGLQTTCYLLRQARIEPVEVDVGIMRRGRLTNVLEATMSQDDKMVARATAVFAQERPLDEVPERTGETLSPKGAPFDIGPYSQGIPWLRDAVDLRREDSGRFWIRYTRTFIEDAGPLCLSVSRADWISGLTRPGWFDKSTLTAFPNVDITVSLTRAPVGEWLALDGRSHWHENGSGQTFADLYDETGYLGRSAQTIILVDGDRSFIPSGV